MKKILLAIIITIIFNGVVAQDKSVFPKYPAFAEMEDVVSNQFQTYLKLNAFSGLTSQQLQDMLKLVAKAEELMNANWQRAYIGYIKRVEANVIFKTVKIIAQQPGFYENQDLMKLALNYIDKGYGYLNQYNHRDYPPYIVLDTKWAGSQPISEEKATMAVDSDIADQLKGLLTEKAGDASHALATYYSSFGVNYFLIPYGREPQYPYNLAAHILSLSRLLKQYDQRLVDFCVHLLTYNKRPDAEQADKMKPDELIRWKELEAKIYITLDEVIQDAPKGSKYSIVLPDNYPSDYTSSSYEWMIPFIYNFDIHDRLQTAIGDPNTNHLTLDLMKFCVFIAEKHKGPELDTAANAMLQKHFPEVIMVMRKWFGRGDDFQCSNIQWVAANMYSFPTSDDGKKYILKAVKKCKNYK